MKFHQLRHTFVALWVAAGANPREISIRAGHSSVAFTLDRYGHLYQDAEFEVPDGLRRCLLLAPRAIRAPNPANELLARASTASDLLFQWWPQRDLNPCYRLERSERTVSSIFEPYRIAKTSWANAFGRLWLALSI